MHYERVYIDTVAYELPPEVVTTRDLEGRLASVYRDLFIPEGQLEAMTGIRERRWWAPETRVSEGAALAAAKALAASPVPAEAIEVLVYGGVCREHFEPATACHVAGALATQGLGISPQAAIYDVSNACLGAMSGIVDVANRIELGQIRAGMVVACETAREIVHAAIEQMLRRGDMERFKQSLVTLTGGSAAVAIIVHDGSFGDGGGHRLLGGVTEAAPQHSMLCRWGVEPDPDHDGRDGKLPPLRQFMHTDPVAVLEHGVGLGRRTWRRLMAELGWLPKTVDRTICHQVGKTHREAILAAIGIPKANDFVTYDVLGNTGTVALPITLAMAAEQGFVEPGHRVAMLGIGSGLNCLMLGVEW